MKQATRVMGLDIQAIQASSIIIETQLASGLPKFNILGINETTARNCKERVRSVMHSQKLSFPNQRITVNISPDIGARKIQGLDLPILISILLAQKVLPVAHVEPWHFCAELSLDGSLRPVSNGLAIALSDKAAIVSAQQSGCNKLPIRIKCRLATHVLEVIAFLKKQQDLPHPTICPTPSSPKKIWPEIIDQPMGCQALEIAAVGGHDMILTGPPGCGKSLLAHRLSQMIPTLTPQEQITCAAIKAAAGLPCELNDRPPFQAPHHSISLVGLVGGGQPIKPGVISLAHHGVLFLDEIAEISRQKLECLREPLQNKTIYIARAGQTAIFPTNFQLVCAMNPCPCGYANHPDIECTCSHSKIQQYQAKLSGPFLDRIAIQTSLLPPKTLKANPNHNQILSSHKIQQLRSAQFLRQNCLNCHLTLNHEVFLDRTQVKAKLLIEKIFIEKHWSIRKLTHIYRLARTLADIAKEESILEDHVYAACLLQTQHT